MTIALVVVILVGLIVVHELGHFIAAKLFGVRVQEFGVGYPPRAFLFGKIGETEYTLNWLPFGGFVRLFGEQEDSDEHGRGSFIDSPRWKQAIILIAGVFMNALAAWGLFTWALTQGVPRVVDQLQPSQESHLVVSDVVDGSPAAVAGIIPGDEIISLEDTNGTGPSAMTPDAFVAFVSDHGGKPLTITYLNGAATTTASLIPAHAVVSQDAGRPAIGIGLVLIAKQALPLADAFKESFAVTKNAFVMVAEGLWQILKSAAHGAPNLSDVVGPVGLVSVVGEASRNGIGQVLELAAFISINLTIVNLIPIPALDGGRLLIVVLEGVMRKSAPRLAIELLNTVGIALIILLMITVTYHDIARLFV